MAQIPTIKIQDGDGVAVINETDFDPAIHTHADEPESEPITELNSDDPPAEFEYDRDAHTVKHQGAGKWFVFDAEGKKVYGPMNKAEAEELQA